MFLVGWLDEQIEGWRVMLERNVSVTFYWSVNLALRLVNLNSQRKIKSFRNTSFLGISRARLNSHVGRGDPD